MSPTAEQARTVILDSAPACIATLGADTLRGQRAAELLALAQEGRPLTAFAVGQLEAYARTMQRNPPTPRTIINLLTWLTTSMPA